MSRAMLLIPVEGPVTETDAPTFTDMRTRIGCDYLERVRVGDDYSIAVDEDGHAKGLPINARASLLYGTHKHGVPILGDVLLAREAMVGDGIDWVDCDLAELATFLLSRLPQVSA